MWHSGDYRVIFRYEYFPRAEQVRDAIEKMQTQECVVALPRTSGDISEAVLHDTQVMSVVVIQKRIYENELHAWATLGVGYSFCSKSDRYIKREGRQLSFERALLQVNEPHKTQVVLMWNKKASKSCRPLV